MHQVRDPILEKYIHDLDFDNFQVSIIVSHLILIRWINIEDPCQIARLIVAKLVRVLTLFFLWVSLDNLGQIYIIIRLSASIFWGLARSFRLILTASEQVSLLEYLAMEGVDKIFITLDNALLPEFTFLSFFSQIYTHETLHLIVQV